VKNNQVRSITKKCFSEITSKIRVRKPYQMVRIRKQLVRITVIVYKYYYYYLVIAVCLHKNVKVLYSFRFMFKIVGFCFKSKPTL